MEEFHENCHYVTATAKLPEDFPAGEVYKHLDVGFVVDIETLEVLDGAITLLTPTAQKFLLSKIIGKKLSDEGFTSLEKELIRTYQRELFLEVLELLELLEKEDSNVIRQFSTGARGGENTIDWRGQMLDLNVEMASLSTGSSNFPSSVNANSPELIAALAKKMKDHGIKPEIEAFDLAMISNAEYLMKKGVLEGPLHFNLVMNVPGSIKGTPKNLMTMVDSLPEGSTWSLTAVGRSHVQLATMAIAMGGHVRTGLEDVVEMSPGVPATNKELVERIIKIAEATGREIATPDKARKILSLKKRRNRKGFLNYRNPFYKLFISNMAS